MLTLAAPQSQMLDAPLFESAHEEPACRRSYIFAVVGLNASDIQRLTAFLAFLQNRLKDKWHLGDVTGADLILAGVGTEPRELSPWSPFAKVLRVGTESQAGVRLTLPLQLGNIHAEFDAAGAALRHSLMAGTESAQRAAAPALLPNARFGLTRWPSAVLLKGDLSRIRICAAMMHQQATVTQISERTKLPGNMVTAFLTVLIAAGATLALEIPAPVVESSSGMLLSRLRPSDHSGNRGSLVSRIRRRLGL